MEQYRVKENGFYGALKRTILTNIGILLFFMVGLFLLSYFDSNKQPFPFLIVFRLIAFTLFLNVIEIIINQKKVAKSYQLTFDDKVIVSEQQNRIPTRIPFHSISIIRKNLSGALVIIGKEGASQKTIIVPPEIEKKEEVMAKLEAIKPITDNSFSFFRKKKN